MNVKLTPLGNELARWWPDYTARANGAASREPDHATLNTSPPVPGMRLRGGAWSPEENEYIRLHWTRQTDKVMARALNRSPGALAAHRRWLGLTNTWLGSR